jgi:hypothetical protein
MIWDLERLPRIHRMRIGCAIRCKTSSKKPDHLEKHPAKIVFVMLCNLHLRFEKARFMFSVGRGLVGQQHRCLWKGAPMVDRRSTQLLRRVQGHAAGGIMRADLHHVIAEHIREAFKPGAVGFRKRARATRFGMIGSIKIRPGIAVGLTTPVRGRPA